MALFMLSLRISEYVVADDRYDRIANKAGDVITERAVTSDRKRKCSSGGDNGFRSESCGDVDSGETSKSIRPAEFTVERPIAVRMSIASTPSSGTAVLQTIWSPPAHHCETTRGDPQVPDGRPMTTHRGYTDSSDKLYALPLGVVDMWHKNWSSPVIIEPTLCRESVLPVLLLSSSSCCQLSN